MFWTYMKMAFRNLRKERPSAVISVAGLAIGLAFFALLAAYVRDDLMFDRFHAKADRTYLSFIHVALTAVAFDLTMWSHN